MATKSPKTPEEEPNRFLRIMQFQAWFFLALLVIDIVYILIKGLASGNGLFSEIGVYSMVIALITMIGTGLSFGLSYQIEATPARKKTLFTSFYISMAIVTIVAVFVLSAYQW